MGMSETSFGTRAGDRGTIRRSGEHAGAAGRPAALASPRCAGRAAAAVEA